MMQRAVLNRRPLDRPSPTPRDVLAIFFRQRRLLVSCFLLAFLAVLLYAALAPNYEAHMKILVRRGRLDPVVTAQASAPAEFTREEIAEEELNSEVELLSDEEMLRKVVQAAGLASNDPLRFLHFGRNDEEAQIARAVERLGKGLQVEAVRKTNLIDVRYRSRNPELAAQVLTALSSFYVEKHAQVHRPSGEFRFFEQQSAQYSQRLTEAEAGLVDFTRGQGVVSAALERDIALQKLSEADAGYRQLRLAIAETGRRIRVLETQMPSLPQRSTTEVHIADNPQLMEKMKSKLLELELKRTELLTKYEPSYRLVQEVDQQIAEAKGSIAAETQNPLREETTNKDPNYEWARTELEKAKVDLSGLQSRASMAGVQLENSRSLARQLAEDTITQDNLIRTMKTAEENYLLYVRKREEARIGDALDERGILNVLIAEQPHVPALPARSMATYAILGLFLAVTCSTGIAFASDFMDPAFRTPDEVTAYLDTPVLASLPGDLVYEQFGLPDGTEQ